MKANKIIFRNASWIIGCRLVQSVLQLVINMLTARYLGPSNYGIISYAASFVAFFTPIALLGLNSILVQETLDNPNDEGKILGTSITLSFFSAILSLMSMATLVSLLDKDDKTIITVCCLYGLILIAQAIELIQYWFQAKLLSKYYSVISLCAYVIVSIYKVYLLITNKSVYWFAVSNAVDYFLIGTALIIVYNNLGGQKFMFSLDYAKKLYSKSRYYIVSSLMVTIFANTDKIMLKMMINETATGYYSTAVTCAGITSFVFGAIIDSFRPVIINSKKSDKNVYEKNISRLYCIIIYSSLVQSLLITLLANPIVTLLYGNAYSHSVPILQVLVWYTTFSYLGPIRNIWILSENKQKYIWIINMSGALTNIILNALLIPFLGMAGAAWASLITQIFTNFIINYIINPLKDNNRLIAYGLNLKLLFNNNSSNKSSRTRTQRHE